MWKAMKSTVKMALRINHKSFDLVNGPDAIAPQVVLTSYRNLLEDIVIKFPNKPTNPLDGNHQRDNLPNKPPRPPLIIENYALYV